MFTGELWPAAASHHHILTRKYCAVEEGYEEQWQMMPWASPFPSLGFLANRRVGRTVLLVVKKWDPLVSAA